MLRTQKHYGNSCIDPTSQHISHHRFKTTPYDSQKKNLYCFIQYIICEKFLHCIIVIMSLCTDPGQKYQMIPALVLEKKAKSSKLRSSITSKPFYTRHTKSYKSSMHGLNKHLREITQKYVLTCSRNMKQKIIHSVVHSINKAAT